MSTEEHGWRQVRGTLAMPGRRPINPILWMSDLRYWVPWLAADGWHVKRIVGDKTAIYKRDYVYREPRFDTALEVLDFMDWCLAMNKEAVRRYEERRNNGKPKPRVVSRPSSRGTRVIRKGEFPGQHIRSDA